MKIKIFLDMDGVLVNFRDGLIKKSSGALEGVETLFKKAEDALRMKLPEELALWEKEHANDIEEDQIVIKFARSLKGTPLENLPEVKSFKKLANDVKGKEAKIYSQPGFYLELEPMADMNELVSFVKTVDPEFSILTAPITGTPEVVERCCEEKRQWVKSHISSFNGKVFCDHNKFKYATPEDGILKILIDDRSKNLGPWKAAGGVGIMHTSAQNSIHQLREIVNQEDSRKKLNNNSLFMREMKLVDIIFENTVSKQHLLAVRSTLADMEGDDNWFKVPLEKIPLPSDDRIELSDSNAWAKNILDDSWRPELILDVEELDENGNAIGAGNVVGYILPMGMPGIGTDDKMEKGFWRDQSKKKVKTASPALHKKTNLSEKVDSFANLLFGPTPPAFLFHATNEENATEIAFTGRLIPHRPDFGTDQEVWPDGSRERRTYFGTSPEHVRPFYPADGKPTLLKVPSHIVKFKKERGTPDWYTTNSISANEISYLDPKTNEWEPIANLAADLSEDLGQMQDVDTPTEDLHMVKGLWKDSPKTENKNFNSKLLKKMGYDYAGRSDARLGSETFVQNDDKQSARSKKIIKAVNKNLDKTRKDPLHDPGGVGISLPKKLKG